MIRQLEIEGFKRFERNSLSFAPLTVLTGLNGSGKTSLIHSLLLMREALHGISRGTVGLNGPFGLNLGTVGDVANWAASEKIVFRCNDDQGQHEWALAWPADDAMYLSVQAVPESPPAAFSADPGAFSYLCAERLGPRGIFEASSLPAECLEIGVRGEYSAQIIEAIGSKPASPERLHPDSTDPSLLKYEVERWLSEIARPVELDAVRHADSNVYAFKFRAPGGDWVRATNMGFGVSYALPIVIAGLTAKLGGLLIVENPEAHLHPAGQSRIGVFLGWLSGRGVQVVVETHSDHVLNGMRRAVADYEYLKASDAVVHFFGSEVEALVKELRFTDVGGVSHWPQGFFDQYQIDTAALGRIRRKGSKDGIRS